MKRLSGRMALLGALFVASVAQAQVYKWVDEQGRVNYSNLKPATVEEAEIVPIATAPEDFSQPADLSEELKRVRDLTQQLQAGRAAREREQREENLLALQSAYYENLLQERNTPPPSRSSGVVYTPAYAYPFYPYYPCYPRCYPYHRHGHGGLSLSINRPNFQLTIGKPFYRWDSSWKNDRGPWRSPRAPFVERSLPRPQPMGMRRP